MIEILEEKTCLSRMVLARRSQCAQNGTDNESRCIYRQVSEEDSEKKIPKGCHATSAGFDHL